MPHMGEKVFLGCRFFQAGAVGGLCFNAGMRWSSVVLLLWACNSGAPDGGGGGPDLGPDVAFVDGGAADAALGDAALDGAVDAGPDGDLGGALDAAPDGAADLGPDAFRGPLDDVLRLNHVQARGTHNSYHLRPDPLFHPSHDYEHAPLDVQLSAQGVRQFELDTHAVIDGAFDVLHIPRIDPRSSCLAFRDCLATLKGWSDAHPGHLPIVVWIEPKDIGASPADGYEVSVDRMHELDGEILAVWPRSRVFAPDDLRGPHPTLPAALSAEGWPTLGRVRGHIIFSLLDREAHREAYRAGSPNLAGRLLFVNPDGPDDPAAAFFKINDGGSEAARARVAEGFIVTSNVDSPDAPAAENASRRAAALDNGVHFLSSDLPSPRAAGDLDWLDIPGGSPARCNPVTAPLGCSSGALEDL